MEANQNSDTTENKKQIQSTNSTSGYLYLKLKIL